MTETNGDMDGFGDEHIERGMSDIAANYMAVLIHVHKSSKCVTVSIRLHVLYMGVRAQATCLNPHYNLRGGELIRRMKYTKY